MIRRVERADGSVAWKAQYGKKGPAATFDLKYQAEEYEAEQKKNARREKAGLDYEQGPITFGDLAAIWKTNYDPSPWRLRMLAHTEGRWGAVPVRSIKPELFGAWMHRLELSGKTKKHILESARQVFNAGVEWGYLSRSPARPGSFKPPSEKRLRPILPFESWAEVELVAEKAGHYGPLIQFVCATGLRTPSEWIDLTWRDVSNKDRLLTVHGTKTENAARTIPLTQRALDALAEVPKGLGPIFKGKRGGRIDYRGFVRHNWTDALGEAGLEYRTPYEMRHTFATLALEAGAHIEDVSQVLGHANIDITRRFYAKWTKPRLERFRDLLDGA